MFFEQFFLLSLAKFETFGRIFTHKARQQWGKLIVKFFTMSIWSLNLPARSLSLSLSLSLSHSVTRASAYLPLHSSHWLAFSVCLFFRANLWIVFSIFLTWHARQSQPVALPLTTSKLLTPSCTLLNQTILTYFINVSIHYSWPPVLLVYNKLLCLCWIIKSRLTWLVESKPVKHGVSHAVTYPLVK